MAIFLFLKNKFNFISLVFIENELTNMYFHLRNTKGAMPKRQKGSTKRTEGCCNPLSGALFRFSATHWKKVRQVNWLNIISLFLRNNLLNFSKLIIWYKLEISPFLGSRIIRSLSAFLDSLLVYLGWYSNICMDL